MTLTQNVKEEAKKAEFVAVGISNPGMVGGLPHGWIGTVSFLAHA